MNAPTSIAKAVKNAAVAATLRAVSAVCRALSSTVLRLGDHVVDTLFGIGLADPGPRRNKLRKVGFVRSRDVAIPQPRSDDPGGFGADMLGGGVGSGRSERNKVSTT
jgi:hypothetical protein